MIENIKNSSVRFDDALMEQKNFGPYVAVVMKELGITHHDICDEFPVSVPIVKRWIEGEGMPRENMRVHVVSRLAALVVQNAEI